MAIDLKIYRENKGIIKNLKIINEFFIEKFPEKSAGWVGITSLFYAQTAIMNYLRKAKTDLQFKTALKAILWQFLNDVSSYESSRKGKNE